MLLNNLKPAWTQLKQMQTMEPLDTNTILAVIDPPVVNTYSRLQSVLLSFIMFVVLTMVCQGG